MERILTMAQEVQICGLLISAVLIFAGMTTLCMAMIDWVLQRIRLRRDQINYGND